MCLQTALEFIQKTDALENVLFFLWWYLLANLFEFGILQERSVPQLSKSHKDRLKYSCIYKRIPDIERFDISKISCNLDEVFISHFTLF